MRDPNFFQGGGGIWKKQNLFIEREEIKKKKY